MNKSLRPLRVCTPDPPSYRTLNKFLIATAMSFSVRYWAKWFVGFLGYLIFKLAISLLMGRTPSVPSIARPRLVFLEYLVTSVAAMSLCLRYARHVPRRMETLGVIGLVVSFAFGIDYNSPVPVLVGLSLLGRFNSWNTGGGKIC